LSVFTRLKKYSSHHEELIFKSIPVINVIALFCINGDQITVTRKKILKGLFTRRKFFHVLSDAQKSPLPPIKLKSDSLVAFLMNSERGTNGGSLGDHQK
jgi:hypothetical protein